MQRSQTSAKTTRIARLVEDVSCQQLEAYRANPTLIDEHANLERAMRQGSYGRRQLFELIQNGADAMLNMPGGRIVVRLTADALYCANEGTSIDDRGVTAILHSHLSVKRGNEIGRFGLGFKSVLGVTDRPEFHSTAGSFAFDAEASARRIAKIVPDVEQYPTLRLAEPIDSDVFAKDDEHLAELLEWATTVIRLPRDAKSTTWLGEDLANFPGEFLLFCRHVGAVSLEDIDSGLSRTISIESDRDRWILLDADEISEWRVFETLHRPTQAAKDQVGELAFRDELPLIWAVPTTGRSGTGRLWAFFPLGDETTLSGILNAPWKTNDDRSNLLTGEFNCEMLEAASRLVVDSLPLAAAESDPGRALDVMPGRGREARGWGDEILTSSIYNLAVESRSLPDQSGQFRIPSELHLHPEGLPRDVLFAWSDQPQRPVDWVHPSIENRERRSRVNRLCQSAGVVESSLQEWLLALSVDPGSVESLKPCIHVAAKLADLARDSDDGDLQELLQRATRCEILADADGEPACPDDDDIFLPGEHERVCSQIRLIHRTLTDDLDTLDCLERLGIRRVTPALELEALVNQSFYSWNFGDWERFWTVARLVERQQAVELLRGKQICVKNVEGDFVEARFALLPGIIVPSDGTRDAAVAVDTAFHREELGILTEIGLASEPVQGCRLRSELFIKYESEMKQRYIDGRPDGASKPQWNYLVFDRSDYVGPLDPIARLSVEGKAAFVESLIAQVSLDQGWTMRHETVDDYPAEEFDAPEVWATRRHGRLVTSLGLMSVHDCVGPSLDRWSQCLPVINGGEEITSWLYIRDAAEDLGEVDWEAAFARLLELTDDELLGGFYAFACCGDASAPDVIHCRINEGHDRRPVDQVTVVTAFNEFEALAAGGTPCIYVAEPAEAQRLVERWSLQTAAEKVQTSLSMVTEGEPISLYDRFPSLRFHVGDDRLSSVELVECSELREETVTDSGKRSKPETLVIQGERVFWLSDLGIETLLERLDDRLGLELGPDGRDGILAQHANQERQNRFASIRTQPTDENRLLACIGERGIRSHLPVGLIRAVEAEHGSLDDTQLAQLALTVYGPDTLVEYKDELQRAGLIPPQRWAGSRESIRFVRDLGFERVYAGYENPSRPARLSVDGPMLLPPLHDYQREIVEEIHRLVAGETDDQRGLVSLPTGAGKTRVAVEAIVDLIRDHGMASPILWVAQSDELCEQAVQTWREVWRALGGQHELNISRLWANNDVEPVEGGAQVVVATIQKLARCVVNSSYDWLREASMLVIDEAHGATTPAYTEVLNWQSINRQGTRCPLLGLTATPFRGHSEEQTARLAGRFGRNRLDRGLGKDPYRKLQEIEVLSEVEHRVLQGINVTLGSDELAEYEKLRSLPSSVYVRLAGDAARNRTLLDDMLKLPADWPALLFCASVEHAQTMAALLRMAGRTAAPVSAETAPGVRRDVIEKFRRGEIQVLTNYGVLTQGFDAPAVRAIYVARPTFSPNVYQQMIGRGLRGPLNGGKKVCRIVNVEDTFAQFGEALAFQEFEHLWDRQSQ